MSGALQVLLLSVLSLLVQKCTYVWSLAGFTTQFNCFASTKVQILTPEKLRAAASPQHQGGGSGWGGAATDRSAADSRDDCGEEEEEQQQHRRKQLLQQARPYVVYYASVAPLSIIQVALSICQVLLL